MCVTKIKVLIIYMESGGFGDGDFGATIVIQFFLYSYYSVRLLALRNFCILSAIKTIQLLKCSALSVNDGTSSTFFLLFILFKILNKNDLSL